jgi:hypothetical protein
MKDSKILENKQTLTTFLGEVCDNPFESLENFKPFTSHSKTIQNKSATHYPLLSFMQNENQSNVETNDEENQQTSSNFVG